MGLSVCEPSLFSKCAWLCVAAYLGPRVALRLGVVAHVGVVDTAGGLANEAVVDDAGQHEGHHLGRRQPTLAVPQIAAQPHVAAQAQEAVNRRERKERRGGTLRGGTLDSCRSSFKHVALTGCHHSISDDSLPHLMIWKPHMLHRKKLAASQSRWGGSNSRSTRNRMVRAAMLKKPTKITRSFISWGHKMQAQVRRVNGRPYSGIEPAKLVYEDVG